MISYLTPQLIPQVQFDIVSNTTGGSQLFNTASNTTTGFQITMQAFTNCYQISQAVGFNKKRQTFAKNAGTFWPVQPYGAFTVATALVVLLNTGVSAADFSTNTGRPNSAEFNSDSVLINLHPALAEAGDQFSSGAAGSQKDSSLDQGQSANLPNSSHKRKYIPEQAATGATSGTMQPKLGGMALAYPANGPTSAVVQTTEKEKIALVSPELKALISVNDYLSPFGLDANRSQDIKLRDLLLAGMDRNLDLAISRSNSKVQQWNYYSALGKFLPDITMSYLELFAKGDIVVPFNSLAGSLPAGGGTSTGTTLNNSKFSIDSPFIIMSPGFQFFGYQGGKVLFGALQAKHNYKAARSGQNATLSDTLMTLTGGYYNLVLSEALLQIRIQAVHTSEEQLRNNVNMLHTGLATQLAVLQSTTQLSKDKQSLVDQQIARRNASITLAEAANVNLGADLLPVDTAVKKVRLIDPRLTVNDLLRIAIDHRPELKQFEELRLAAKRAIIVAGASLQPSFALLGNIYGIGVPSQIGTLNALGIAVNWRLGGLGTIDAAHVEATRWQAREALLQAHKELVTILGQVRSSLLQSLDTEHNIDEASNEVTSSAEELRLAQLRFKNGIGTNLDIITAQRDYTQALIDKAQAIINFDIAQSQLLHDVGMISVDSITSGRLLTKS